jgi:hypothetical protein
VQGQQHLSLLPLLLLHLLAVDCCLLLVCWSLQDGGTKLAAPPASMQHKLPQQHHTAGKADMYTCERAVATGLCWEQHSCRCLTVQLAAQPHLSATFSAFLYTSSCE